MKPYFNLLIWVILGAMVGLIIYMFVQPPIVKIDIKNESTTSNQTTLVNSSLPANYTTQKKAVTLVILNSPYEQCNYNELAIQQAIDYLSSSDYVYPESVLNLTYPSEEAEFFISEYNITELPTLIIIGNPEADTELVSLWLKNAGTQEADNALVSRDIYPPYYDLALQKPVGLVNGIAIRASNCKECMDADDYMPPLEDTSFEIIFSNKTVLDENDSFAQELIQKYNITKLPVLLLSEDFFIYPVSQYFVSLGTLENDSWFVLRTIKAPYQQLPDHSIRGLVEAIYVRNSSCTDCLDPHELGNYLSQAGGIYIMNETYHESNSTEGLALIKQYNITKIPAILLSPETSVYQKFSLAWQLQNHSVEADGWYVFRNYDLLDTIFQEINYSE